MKLSVRAYLILTFVVVSGIPLAVFWSWPYSRILQSEKTEVRERHLLIAETLASSLSLYHRDLIAAFMAFQDSIAAGHGEEAKVLFANLHFRHICVASASSGEVLASYFDEAVACPNVIPADRLELFMQLTAGERVGISPVVVPPGQEPRIFLASRSGSTLLVGAVHTTFFENLRRQVKFGRAGHAAIVDQTGRVLAHPMEGWAERAIDFRHLEPVRRILNGESGVETFFSPAMEQEMIAGFAAVPVAGWGVLVPQPLSELEETASQFNWDAFWVLSIGLSFSLVMALAISVQFSRRLGRIAAGVHAIAQEDNRAFVPSGSDIVGICELSALETDVNRLAEDSAASRYALVAYNKELEETNQRLTREIDERQVAEIGKKNSELRFRSLFENAPIPIREEDLSGMKALIDELGISDHQEFNAYIDRNPEFLEACGRSIVVVDANQASLALHGYRDKEELLSTVVKTLSADAMKIVRKTCETLHRGESGRSYETTITRVDGTKRTVAATWSVVPGHEDTYARILLSSVDLTERLKSEDALRQAQKMEAVGQLTGGVAHDFNNLLTVIGGNIELMTLTNDVDPELTAPVQKAVSRGAELTQRLLAFSRNQPLLPRTIDLVDLVRGMTELLRRSLGEEIAINIRNKQSHLFVLADPGQVEAALLNLTLNSRDAMPDGGILTITIEAVAVGSDTSSDLASGEYGVLKVSDTGFGMSEETIDRAFEPFFTTKEVGKGSGLGLSMVYGFAKQSNGDVLVESKERVGTVVSLYLPRIGVEHRVDEPSETVSAKSHGGGQVILILEDDPDVRSYLERLIAASGYNGISAKDAEAARDILDHCDKIDLLVSDVMLPGGVRGPEFAAEMIERFPGTPVIFISGRPSEAKTLAVSSLEDAPVIAKPFDRQKLLHTIEETIGAA